MKRIVLNRRLFAFLLCLWAFTSIRIGVYGQSRSFSFETVQDGEGNMNGSVYTIMQSQNGLMWFGTEGGLVKHDGYSFGLYINNPTDTLSLSNNNIGCLVEDQKGLFWMGTWGGGVNRFDQKTGKFQAFKDCGKKDGSCIGDSRVQSLYNDPAGYVWIGSYSGGLDRYDQATGKFKNSPPDPANPYSISNNRVWASTKDQNGHYWFGTDKGLNTLDISTGKFRAFFNDPENPGSIPHDRTRWVFVDRANRLWVGTQEGLCTADLKGVKPEDYHNLKFKTYKHDPENPNSLAGNTVSVVYEDSFGGLWIGSETGLTFFDRKNDRFYQFYHDPTNLKSISHSDVRRITEDKAGVLWIATRGGGVNKLDLKPIKFKHIKKTEGGRIGLSDGRVFGIADDSKGNLYIGTDGGGLNLIKYKGDDFFNGEITSIEVFMPDPANPQSISNERIRVAALDNKNRAWLGTYRGGLSMFDPETKTFSNFLPDKNDPAAISNFRVHSLLVDKDNILWAGSDDGLNRLDLKTWNGAEKAVFKKNHQIKGEKQSLPHNSVMSLRQDSKGRIWVGTWGGGLALLENGADETFEIFQNALADSVSLSNNEVFGIFEDSKKNMWILTRGGLNKFLPDTKTFKRFFQEDGLAGSECYGIAEDSKGVLWISTNNGVSAFDPEKNTFRNYNIFDGLQANAFQISSYFHAANGVVYFGGVNGFNAFIPEKVKDNPHIPQVILTSFKKFGKEITFEGGLENVQEIVLDYSDNFFSFEFAGLDYTRPEKNRYAFMLEGFNEAWIYSGNRRFASYTNLKGGEYVFRVKAANNDGVWNETGTSIKIIITPPFWDTLWFKISSVLIVASASFGFYRYRVHKVEAQKEVLELMVKERTAKIGKQRDELEEQKNEILVQNEELEQQQEEIMAQRDHIENKNAELEEANTRVIAQKQAVEASYSNIRILSQIGQKITSILDIPGVVSTVYENLTAMIPAEGFGIGVYNAALQSLDFTGYIELGETLPDHSEPLGKDSLANYCFRTGEDIFINDIFRDAKPYLKTELKAETGGLPLSLIYVPLMSEGQIVGVITVQSFQKSSYTESHLVILKTIAAYTAIAINNSYSYQELKGAKQLIEEKNTHIMDSIRYAETIQKGILPRKAYLDEHLAGHCILFKPKDVVSGDFYWFLAESGRLFAAAIDCTGHGVPGAFMSMVGNTLLNDIVGHQKEYSPAKILAKLHEGVKSVLHQEEGANNDGMDVCLCVFDVNAGQLLFAGAKRPLYHLSQNGLEEYKGSKKSIGGRQKEDRDFEETRIYLQKGDVFYLTTDGFADQNNPKLQKFGTKRFKDTLLDIKNIPIAEHAAIWAKLLAEHAAGAEQRDDISMLAVCFR